MRFPRAVRALGQSVLGGVPVPIRSGYNRGLRWSLAALGRGYGSGTFGRDRLEALEAVVRQGDTFWDLGAHKGFVTLAAARMVGPSGRVVAVEPASVNLRFLRRHLEWNGVVNARVVTAALSDRNGVSSFGGGGSSVAFHLGEGDETVPVKTLDQLAAELDVPRPGVLKLDVEGEEAAVLRGAGRLLGGDQAVLASTHSRALYEECRALLEERGFRVLDSWEIAARRSAPMRPWSSDHDLLAIGSGRRVDEQRLRALRLIAGPA